MSNSGKSEIFWLFTDLPLSFYPELLLKPSVTLESTDYLPSRLFSNERLGVFYSAYIFYFFEVNEVIRDFYVRFSWRSSD